MKKISLILALTMLMSILPATFSVQAESTAVLEQNFDSEVTGNAPQEWNLTSTLTGNNYAKVMEGHGGKYLKMHVESGSNVHISKPFESQTSAFTASFDMRLDATSTRGFQFKFSDWVETEKIGPNIIMDLNNNSNIKYHNGSSASDLPEDYKVYMGGWYHFTFIINPAASNYDMYIGNKLVGDNLSFRQAPEEINCFIVANYGSAVHDLSIDNFKIESGEVIPSATTYLEEIDFETGIAQTAKRFPMTPSSSAAETDVFEATEKPDSDGKYYKVNIASPTAQIGVSHYTPFALTGTVTAEFDFMIDPKSESAAQIRITGSSGTGTNISVDAANKVIKFHNGSTLETSHNAFYAGQWYRFTVVMNVPTDGSNCTYDAYINGVQCANDYTCRSNVTSVDRINFLTNSNNKVNAFNIDNIKIYNSAVAPNTFTAIDNNFEYFEASDAVIADPSLIGWSKNTNITYKILSDSNKAQKTQKYLRMDTASASVASTYTIQNTLPSDSSYTLSYDFAFPSDGTAGYQLRLGDGSKIGPNISFKINEIKATDSSSNITLSTSDLGADAWHTITLIINPLNSVYDAYLDGKVLKSGIGFRQAPADLQKFTLFSLNAGGALAFDNFKVESGAVVPEEPKLEELYRESFDEMEAGTVPKGWGSLIKVVNNPVGDGKAMGLVLENLESAKTSDYKLPQIIEEDDFTFSTDIMIGNSNEVDFQLNFVSDDKNGKNDMQLTSIMVNENKMTAYYNENEVYGLGNNFSNQKILPGIGEKGKWHNLKFYFDMSEKSYDLYIDNVLAAEDVLFRYSAASSFKYIRINAGTAGKDYEVYFDNMVVCRGYDGIYYQKPEFVDNNGNLIASITPNTTTGKIKVLNAGNANSSFVLFTASYNGDRLSAVNINKEITVANDELWHEFEAVITPVTGDNKLKAFVWNSDSGMLPVLDVSSFDVPQTEKDAATLFVVGDSTVENYTASSFPDRKGWGQVIGEYLKENITVENHAEGGRSSKSFITEGRMVPIMSKMEAGDYLILQMGHNDRKTDAYYNTDSETTFKDMITKYINMARQKGAHVILVTPPTQLVIKDTYEGFDYNGNGNGIKPYAEAMKDVALANNIPYVDLYEYTKTEFADLGVEYCKENVYMYNKVDQNSDAGTICKDGTHFCENGAKILAEYITETIKENDMIMSKFVK